MNSIFDEHFFEQADFSKLAEWVIKAPDNKLHINVKTITKTRQVGFNNPKELAYEYWLLIWAEPYNEETTGLVNKYEVKRKLWHEENSDALLITKSLSVGINEKMTNISSEELLGIKKRVVEYCTNNSVNGIELFGLSNLEYSSIGIEVGDYRVFSNEGYGLNLNCCFATF